MLTGANPEPERSLGMNLYVVASVTAFAVVLGYLGWVFWSRAQETRAIEERAAAQRRAQDEQTVDAMGGNRFDILSFYATEGEIVRGGSSDLCYSTSNAKTVTISPTPAGPVRPAYERCVSVSPRKTTTYALVATDGAGHTKSATATVVVQ
ncbi:MAG: hypothetical protein ABSE45_03725 [Candidatus Acidiferrales bacterium]